MKATKLFDGAYELASWRKRVPVPHQRYKQEVRGDEFSDKLWKIGVKLGVVHSHYHYTFPAGHFAVSCGSSRWHLDGSQFEETRGYSHLLMMIACDNPGLGTDIANLADSRIMRCKVWTPYLLHWRVLHRTPPDSGTADRLLYRFFLKLKDGEYR